jgi:hypothetical protein
VIGEPGMSSHWPNCRYENVAVGLTKSWRHGVTLRYEVAMTSVLAWSL